jgi:hypothetical protein
LELDIGISRAQELSEEPEAGNRMSNAYSKRTELLLDGTEDIIQAHLAESKDKYVGNPKDFSPAQNYFISGELTN